MCLIVFAYHVHPDFALVAAANRDEVYDRPTSAAHFWSPNNSDDGEVILAGKDLEAGGAWLGINKRGRFAALTNYREPVPTVSPDKKRSRGELVADFLVSNLSALEFLNGVQPHAMFYEGFNLVVGDDTGLYYFSNRGGGMNSTTTMTSRKLEPGHIYGLCNRLLDDPWTKVERSKQGMAEILKNYHQGQESKLEESLLSLFGDREKVPTKEDLPETGCSQEFEMLASSIFINSDWYGTRATTIVSIPAAENSGEKGIVQCSFVERSFGPEGKYLGEVKKAINVSSGLLAK